MSVLHPADRPLHHEDGSHRWGGGPADPAGQAAYRAQLVAHMGAHRAQPYQAPARRRPLERAS